ncbi:MAG TPA: YceI family protein [Allosphingosinicella sp.]|nr:YceI family protein [Allosphingosinicella sp.]
MSRSLITAAFALMAATAVAQPAPHVSHDPATIPAGTYAVEPTHTRIQFTVSHMGFTDWYGDFTHVSGSLRLDPAHPRASRVEIEIPVASVSTTNATLDGELKGADWFDAARFPTMRFVSTRIMRTGPNRALIAGNLTMHGVTRPVSLAASFNGAGTNPLDKSYTIGFDATATIRRSAFGVTKYVPLIGDSVAIRISAAFERK